MKHINLAKDPCRTSLYEIYQTVWNTSIFVLAEKQRIQSPTPKININCFKNKTLAKLSFHSSTICRVEYCTSLIENFSQNQGQHCLKQQAELSKTKTDSFPAKLKTPIYKTNLNKIKLRM